MTVDSVKLLSGEAQMGTASPWCTEARTRGCSCHRWVQGHVSRVSRVSRVPCPGGGGRGSCEGRAPEGGQGGQDQQQGAAQPRGGSQPAQEVQGRLTL